MKIQYFSLLSILFSILAVAPSSYSMTPPGTRRTMTQASGTEGVARESRLQKDNTTPIILHNTRGPRSLSDAYRLSSYPGFAIRRGAPLNILANLVVVGNPATQEWYLGFVECYDDPQFVKRNIRRDTLGTYTDTQRDTCLISSIASTPTS